MELDSFLKNACNEEWLNVKIRVLVSENFSSTNIIENEVEIPQTKSCLLLKFVDILHFRNVGSPTNR